MQSLVSLLLWFGVVAMPSIWILNVLKQSGLLMQTCFAR